MAMTKQVRPDLLELYELAVDGDRQQHPEKVVGECGEDRPHERPAEQTEKRARLDRIAEEDVGHVRHADPREQVSGGLVVSIKVREGNEDHKDDRQHREEDHCEHREREQRHMEFLVPHGAEIVPEGSDRAAVLGVLLRAPRVPDVGIPEIEKHGAHRGREHAEEQNQHGVIAGEALEDLQLLVPYLALRLRAERCKLGEILHRKIPEEENKPDLAEQIRRAADELLIPDAARAHDEKRQARPKTASRRGIQKYVTFFSVHRAPPLSLGLVRKNRKMKPGKGAVASPFYPCVTVLYQAAVACSTS